MSDLRALGSGYFEVFVDGAKVSQHTTERNAAERAYDEKMANPAADVRYKQQLEVVLEGFPPKGLIYDKSGTPIQSQ